MDNNCQTNACGSSASSPAPNAERPATKSRARLLGNRLLVRRLNRPTSIGGIFIPETMRDDENIGGPKEYLVCGVGPGLTNRKGLLIPIPVNCGDRVICHSYFTGAIEIPDVPEMFIITADQVLAVIPNESNTMPPNPNAPGHNKPGDSSAAEPADGTVMEPTSVESVDGAGFIIKRQHYQSLPAGEYTRQARQYGGDWQDTFPKVTNGPGIDTPIDIPLGGPQAGVDWRLVAS